MSYFRSIWSSLGPILPSMFLTLPNCKLLLKFIATFFSPWWTFITRFCPSPPLFFSLFIPFFPTPAHRSPSPSFLPNFPVKFFMLNCSLTLTVSLDNHTQWRADISANCSPMSSVEPLFKLSHKPQILSPGMSDFTSIDLRQMGQIFDFFKINFSDHFGSPIWKRLDLVQIWPNWRPNRTALFLAIFLIFHLSTCPLQLLLYPQCTFSLKQNIDLITHLFLALYLSAIISLFISLSLSLYLPLSISHPHFWPSLILTRLHYITLSLARITSKCQLSIILTLTSATYFCYHPSKSNQKTIVRYIWTRWEK